MSGMGGGKPAGFKAYRRRPPPQPQPSEAIESAISSIARYVEELEKRVRNLEEAYIEDKLLSPNPGKIDE